MHEQKGNEIMDLNGSQYVLIFGLRRQRSFKSTFSLSKGAVTLMKCTSWALLKRGLYSAHTGQEADIFLISSLENDKFRLLT